jgi:tetratricopeptide (TPR) repeat protein
MADFCRRALAYITHEHLDSFKKLKTPELSDRLLHHLRDRPWLLVLDGLERVLVAYHRFDAAQVADEEANQPTDQIAQRDPCAAIRPEDDDLLRALAAAAPSKLLITSRLVPRVLLNPASQAIPGVLRVALQGLRPVDAEALLRSCGVTGDSQAIQNYLKSHCDCHPLVTGVLGGIINDYLPARGNFDAWAADATSGGQLNLADLNLVQNRNHILKAALDAVPEKGRQLLSILALLSEAVDYPTLSALNPHLPNDTVRDLERRGVLQYDGQTRRYDLHPVVRGIAAGGLRPEEKDGYGQRVVDHFSAKAHRPYDEAETMEDLRNSLHVIRTLLKMGRYQQASEAYTADLSSALLTNLEANAEVLSLLRPFFPQGWATQPNSVDERGGAYLANEAAIALSEVDELKESLAAYGAALEGNLRGANWPAVCTIMTNISDALRAQNRLAHVDRCLLSNLISQL